MKNALLWVLIVFICFLSCSPQIKTVSPSPSPSPAAQGIAMGKIMLQGRTTYEGITVTIGELPPVTTNPDGTYIVKNVPPGQHTVKVEKAGYLSAEGQLTISSGSETKTLASVTLLAGDLNSDGGINLFDLVLLSTAFGKQDVENLPADLNGDGTVNLFDLILVGKNLYQSGPMALEAL